MIKCIVMWWLLIDVAYRTRTRKERMNVLNVCILDFTMLNDQMLNDQMINVDGSTMKTENKFILSVVVVVCVQQRWQWQVCVFVNMGNG